MNANKKKLAEFLEDKSNDNIYPELSSTEWGDLDLFKLFIENYDKTKQNHLDILEQFMSNQNNQVKKIKFLVSNKLYNIAIELFSRIQDENTKNACMNFFIRQRKHFKELYKEFKKQESAKNILIKFLDNQLEHQAATNRLHYLKNREHLFRVPDCCIPVLETNNSNIIDEYFELLAKKYLMQPDENLIPTGKEYLLKFSAKCYLVSRPKVLAFLQKKELIIDPTTHEHILDFIGKKDSDERVKELLKQYGILDALGLHSGGGIIEELILVKLIEEFAPDSELEKAYKCKKKHKYSPSYRGAIQLFSAFLNEKKSDEKLALLKESEGAYLKSARKKNFEDYHSKRYFLADNDFTNKLRKSISNFAWLETYYYLKYTTPSDVDSINAIKHLIEKFNQKEINELARTILNKIIDSENNSPAVADATIQLLHENHIPDFKGIYAVVKNLAIEECRQIGKKIVDCLYHDDQKSLNRYKEKLKAISGKSNLDIDQAIEKLHDEKSNTRQEESIFISSFLSSAFDHKAKLIKAIDSKKISNRLNPKTLSRAFDERSPQMITVLKSTNRGKALFKLNKKPFSYWPEALTYDFNRDIQSFNTEKELIVQIFHGKRDSMLKELRKVVKSKYLQSLLDQAMLDGNTYINQERIKYAIRTTYKIKIEYGDITVEELTKGYQKSDMTLFGSYYPYEQIVNIINSRYIDRSVKEAIKYAHLVAIELQKIYSNGLKTTEKQTILLVLISLKSSIYKLSYSEAQLEELKIAKASLQSISGYFDNFGEQLQSIEDDIDYQLSKQEITRKEILSEINSAKMILDKQSGHINLPKFPNVNKNAINNQDIVLDFIKNLLVVFTISIVLSVIFTDLSALFAIIAIILICVLAVDSFNKVKNATSIDDLQSNLKEDPSICFSRSKDFNAQFLITQAQAIIKNGTNLGEISLQDQYRLHLIYDELDITENYSDFINNLSLYLKSAKIKQKGRFNDSSTYYFLSKNFNLRCDSLSDISEKVKTRQAIYQQLKLYAQIQSESVDNDFLRQARRNGAFLDQDEAKTLIQSINNPEKDQDLLKARFTNLDEIFKPSNFPASSKEITSASTQKKQQPSQQLERRTAHQPEKRPAKRPPHKPAKRPPHKPAIKPAHDLPKPPEKPIQWHKIFSRRQTRMRLTQRNQNTIYPCSFYNQGNTCWINAMLSVIVNSDLVDDILTAGKDPKDMSPDEYTLYSQLVSVINQARENNPKTKVIDISSLFSIFDKMYQQKDPNWFRSGGSEPACFLQEIDSCLGSLFVAEKAKPLTCCLYFSDNNVVREISDHLSTELTLNPYDSNQSSLSLNQCLSHKCLNTKTDGASANTVKDLNGHDINYDYSQTVLASKPDTLVVNLKFIQTHYANKNIDHSDIFFLVKEGENYFRVSYRMKSETVHVGGCHWIARNYEYKPNGTSYCHTHNDSTHTKNDLTKASDSRFNIAILEKVGNEIPLTQEQFNEELRTMAISNNTPQNRSHQGGLFSWLSWLNRPDQERKP